VLVGGGVRAWENQYAPPGVVAGEEPSIRAAGGAGKNYCKEDAGKYCGTKDAGRNCCVGVLYCCPRETPIIMCVEPCCLDVPNNLAVQILPTYNLLVILTTHRALTSPMTIHAMVGITTQETHESQFWPGNSSVLGRAISTTTSGSTGLRRTTTVRLMMTVLVLLLNRAPEYPSDPSGPETDLHLLAP
jgi:hypothetical protein